MINSQGGDLREALPPDHDSDRWWPLLAGYLQKPRAMESTTVTALLLLFIVATGDRKDALPSTGEVLNLVCALEQDQDGAPTNAKQRAGLVTRLSAALSGLRGELD
jgi:hypothetical protein